jgi:hypothetical protein
MHKLILGLAAAAALLVPSAAQAAIRMKAITYCPAAAEYAFKVVGAKGEIDGVRSEYEWLARSLPGWKRDAQALVGDRKGRLFDLLYVSKGRKKQVLCFDITAFYGKMG